jgi:hypothetical protein
MPNLALQQVFVTNKKFLLYEDSKKLKEYLLGGFKMNVIVLLGSAAIFKVFQPFIVKTVTTLYRMWSERNIQKHEDPSKNNIFNQMQAIKLRAEEQKLEQESRNDELIYSLSFTTNCLISISFYGLIVPTIIFYIFPALLCALVVDYFRFTSELKSDLSSTIKELKQTNSEKELLESIHTELMEQEEKIKQDDLSKNMQLLKQNKYLNAQGVPKTIYLNFISVLVLVTFPFSIIGFYGLTEQFEEFLIDYPEQEQKQNMLKLSFNSVFKKMINRNIMEKNINRPFIFVMMENLHVLFTSTIKAIGQRPKIQMILVAYILFVIWYRRYFTADKFINRIQNKIWKMKLGIKGKFNGESYRSLNPAYWIK